MARNSISLLGLYLVAGISSVVMVTVFMLVLHQHPSSDELSGAVFRADSGSVLDIGSGETERDLNDIGTTLLTTVDDQVTQSSLAARSRKPSTRYNVLFMITDDMRTQIGCYADDANPLTHPRLLTPNLDRLASESLLLKKAYTQFTLCGPSRTSILTGRRPDTNRIFDNRQYWRSLGGNFTTMPQYFKENGYRVVGIGKVFHRDVSSGDNDPFSWSEPIFMANHTENHYLNGKAGWRPVTKEAEKRVPLMDDVAVAEAKRYLSDFADDAKSGKRPFFLGFGFKKPHSSYVCPERFYDLYPLETEDQFLDDLSWQTIRLKRTRNLENITILDDGQAEIPHETLRHLRRGYFACVSYVDHLVGELMRTLSDLDLADSTVVSFMADHGYHFGENGKFGKQTLHETATHVPMMVRIPGSTDSGLVSESVVESLDLFPTLVDGGRPAARS
ncbi:hypothetical protein LSH36_1170g00095 [Paralvinella palmiformis]|uniref:Sulfatase N-terminal domain-containing protein n=1 Tax=Paralvinella palmiformis TaxID=53620 RepID=A0AAD9MS56_9ANNE|nr:hypothetical protein LSH36_1170g00095 [Paralvinella palmiformis]